MFDRRIQLVIDQERYDRIVAQARRRNLSISAVIREAIDRALPAEASRRAAAAKRILAAPAMPVPEPDHLRAELDELRGRRR